MSSAAFAVFRVARSWGPFPKGRYVGIDPDGLAAVCVVDPETDRVQHFAHAFFPVVWEAVKAGALEKIHGPTPAALRPEATPSDVSAPIHAESVAGALFELLHQVGGRMPREAN